MLYIRKQFKDGSNLEVRINEADLFTECPECGANIAVEKESLKDFAKHGFDNVYVYCFECAAKRLAKRQGY